jgi:hypothetical protein
MGLGLRLGVGVEETDTQTEFEFELGCGYGGVYEARKESFFQVFHADGMTPYLAAHHTHTFKPKLLTQSISPPGSIGRVFTIAGCAHPRQLRSQRR